MCVIRLVDEGQEALPHRNSAEAGLFGLAVGAAAVWWSYWWSG
jgi:hypothetical protein